MRNENEIITCIVQRGKADKIVKSAIKAGAQGATMFYGRGTGVRQKLGFLGTFINPEKEIIFIVTHKETTDAIFEAIISEGELDKPGKGFAFIQIVGRSVGFIE
ncbi:MAG: P-II family nitrogen regulator [Nitrospirae bacterium]|nr:P-II family nitrogen regulator [Nitrospirota bacterium]